MMKFFKIYLLICLTYFTVEAAAARSCWEYLGEGSTVAFVASSSAPTPGAIAKAKSLLTEQKFADE